MRRWLIAAAAAAVLLPTAASAEPMNAEVFHRRATTLQKKGAAAVFSMGEIKKLAAEGRAAGQRARASRLAAIIARRTPRYCPPEGPQAMPSSEFMTRLAAIPAAQRAQIDMTEAMIRILAVKFPC